MNPAASTANTQSEPRKYTRRSQARWRELVENFNQSELTLDAYCQQHGIAPSGFYAWRKRFECQSRVDTSVDPLIDITPQLNTSHPSSPQQAGNTSWQVELELGRSCILRIRTA